MQSLVRALILALVSVQLLAQQTLPDAAAKLRSGPMLGYSEKTETIVWLQTTAPALVQIRFWKEGDPKSARLSAPTTTSAAGDHIAKLVIPALEFGTRYQYELYLDGQRVHFEYPLTFQTQRMWEWRTDPPDFRAAAGSCAYINDPPFDRPGTPYGSEMQIFGAIAAQKADIMLWLGDNIYYREGDWESESGMRYRWSHDRSLPELQPLLASTHHYAIWDDHDYGPNDSDRTYMMKEESLQVFRDYSANRNYGFETLPGVFQKFSFSDVDFFMLDDRYYRSPNRMPTGPQKEMFGEGQMQWLMEALKASRAPFKVIANGNQMINATTNDEGLAIFPLEQARLLSFIREARIEGVIFLSGDKHHAVLLRRDLEGLYPLYELTTSSMTAGLYDQETERNNPLNVDGTYVGTSHNFALLDFTGPRKDRKLTITLADPAGKTLWKRTIAASELTFPAEK